MIGENSVFVGVGQCGGNIAWSIEQKSGLAYYINTASEDLDCIQSDDDKKYHIPGAKGTAKNEEIAKEILFQDGVIDSLCNNIHSRYANSKIVTFGYSAGGGTGGTMGNYIVEAMKEIYPEKIMNVVLVLPDKNEDVIIQLNALRCLKHLNKLYEDGIVNSIQLLDNNKGNYKDVNENFSMTYTRFLDFDSFDKDGNLDSEEQIDVVTAPGSMAMYEFSSDKSFLDGLMEAVNNSVYFRIPKLPEVLGMIVSDKNDMEEALLSARQVVGFAKITHKSKWEEDSNIVISSGVDFEKQFILAENHLKKQISDIENERLKSAEEALNEINEIQKETSVDIDTVKASRRSRRTSTVTTTNKPVEDNKRRRRRSSSIDLREKYRNL
ncbi:hypothetical protein ACV3OO_12270 [Clostridium perfringens]